MAQRRALIIGGSMSGLLAALMLQHAVGRSMCYERVATRTWPAAAPASGAGRPHRSSAAPSALRYQRPRRGPSPPADARSAGRVMAARPNARRILTAPGSTSIGVLRDAFPSAHYHRGRELYVLRADYRRVVAHFSDGSVAEGDVLIGADGLRSTVRQPCLPAVAPLYAGYVAWRAVWPEDILPPAIHRDLFATMTFCLPPGEQFLGYPVPARQ